MSGDDLSTPTSKQKLKRMESAPPNIMNKKQATQVETTVFFLPSVDVKVRHAFFIGWGELEGAYY